MHYKEKFHELNRQHEKDKKILTPILDYVACKDGHIVFKDSLDVIIYTDSLPLILSKVILFQGNS